MKLSSTLFAPFIALALLGLTATGASAASGKKFDDGLKGKTILQDDKSIGRRKVVQGTIDLHKDVVSADPNYPAPDMNFKVDITCRADPRDNSIIDLNKGNGFHRGIYNFPLGTTCTVSEQPLKTCHWETSYGQSQTVTIPNKSGAVVNFQITNKWVCQ